LSTGGVPVGIIQDFMYKEESIIFDVGSLLLVYSDGICEAMNADEEPFGEERLEHLIVSNKDKSPEDLINSIIENVKEYSGDTLQMDDITLISIKRVA